MNTHTYATLEVPRRMYTHVRELLLKAGMHRADSGADAPLDMTGLALVPMSVSPLADVMGPSAVGLRMRADLVRDGGGNTESTAHHIELAADYIESLEASLERTRARLSAAMTTKSPRWFGGGK
jgi:hypothetical protein